MRLISLLATFLVISLAAALVVVVPGQGAPGDVGYEGRSFSGTGTPTGTKRAESVLWWNDGSWWANMWDTASQDFHISRLNLATQTWQDSGVAIDTRANTHADVLWDGSRLYVASHTFVNDEQPAVSGFPSYLFRFSYNPATKIYTRDSGFPVQINNMKTETLVIDKDSTGKLWATWQQGDRIFLNRTLNGDDRAWGTPFALPNPAGNVSVDDNSALVAFGGNKMGLMWSNQTGTNPAMWFAYHQDGAPDTTWSGGERPLLGSGDTDDHINLKSLQADSSGRVFAATKTSQTSSASALIMLSVRQLTGVWSSHTIALVSDCPNRPLVLIDEQNKMLHTYYTAPGPPSYDCNSSGGAIYKKASPLNSISFAPGRGTPVVVDADSPVVHNASSTKRNVNGATGIVVLAVNGTTKRYWHHYEALPSSSTPSPSPSPMASPTPMPPATATVPAGATPGTVAINPADDAYVADENVNANYGQTADLVSDGSPVRENFLKFHLQSLAGLNVTSAKLRMFVSNSSSGAQSLKQVADNSWSESTLTYASRPAKGTTITTFTPNTISDWREVDLTGHVATKAGSSMSLVIDAISSDGYAFNSAESASNRVELLVQWSAAMASPTTTPTPSPSPMPTPSPTETPTPSPSPTPTASASPTPTRQPPDFTITVSPAERTVLPGGSTTYTITVTPKNGFVGPVLLSVSGLPQGTTASFSRNPVDASTVASSTLSVGTSLTTNQGSYTLTITGTSGAIRHTATVTLRVGLL